MVLRVVVVVFALDVQTLFRGNEMEENPHKLNTKRIEY